MTNREGLPKPAILAIAGTLALAACSTAPAQQARSPRAADELAKALAGRVPGKPERCIYNDSSVETEVVDDWTILFRDGRTLYVQNPPGGCSGLGNRSRTLVTRPFGSQLCEGDINHLVDLGHAMGGPTCVFGPFIPYRKPG
jgi:hypothetical protein